MSELGYSPKSLKFGQDARDRLKIGITKLAKAVRSTLGPSGQTVLIESPEHLHGITSTKDGVTVAKSISLVDPIENLGVRVMRAAAERTGVEAGDGTTTSVVIAEELVNSGDELIDESIHNKTEVLRLIGEISEDIILELEKMKKDVTDENLHHVSTISANNDPIIGELIADTYKAVGNKGVVKAELSPEGKTYANVVKGIKVDRGYSSNLFVTDFERDECVLNDTAVLVSDKEITNFLSIEHILTPVVKEGKRLLIIAPTSKNTMNTLGANVMRSQGKIKLCVVPPPSFGYRKEELMRDIALSVGATYFSEKTGDDLSLIKANDLGHADKAVIDKDKTVLIQYDSEPSDAIKERVKQLEDAKKHSKTKADKEFLDSRIATLIAGIGVVYAGGETDLERKELFDRVDDAICAVRSALEEGIVAGGGLALSLAMANVVRARRALKDPPLSKDHLVALDILEIACVMPLHHIIANAGLDSEKVYTKKLKKDYGYDVKNKRWGDMFELGVIDPLKVTKNALRNAVSVATTILSTNTVISVARTYEDG